MKKKKSIYTNQMLDWYFWAIANNTSQERADHILHLMSGNKSVAASRMLFKRATKIWNHKEPRELSNLGARAKFYAAKHGFLTALI